MAAMIIPENPYASYGEPIVESSGDANESGPELFRRILNDWAPALFATHPRPIVIKEINKVLKCKKTGDGVMYSCPQCDKVRWVPFTCGSLFCPSCGNLYNQQRANSIGEHMINVPHRHIIFTIPASLRPYFLEDRSLLNCLFDSAHETYNKVISRKWNGNLNTGMIIVLHTFSRSSDWNPHVHCICTEGGFTDWGKWYPRPFIDFEDLRNTMMDTLLKKLRHRINDSSFAEVEADIRATYKESGFFVYAAKPPEKFAGNPKKLVKYVSRYLGRPCIATSRIDNYDGKTVKFHYMAHTKDGEKYTCEELPALDFLMRLVQHIQNPNFKKVRFYGVYASHGVGADALQKALKKPTLNPKFSIHYLYDPQAHHVRLQYCHFRGAMFHAFNFDPLVCPCCQKQMEVEFYAYKGKIFTHPPTKRHSPPVQIEEEETA